MTAILQDLRFALRQLRRSPGFALTAILTLALGIGANTAIFSLLDQALLRSLPVRDPQQLVFLEGTGKLWEGHSSINGGDPEAYFSYPMYRDLRDGSTVFTGLVASAPTNVGLTDRNSSQIERAELVSGNYFTILGVQPALGRLFSPSDDLQPNVSPIAVLSFEFWRSHFASDPNILGSSVSVNGHPFQIVGVVGPPFHSAIWGETPALFVPMAMLDQVVPGKGKRLIDHKDRWMNIIGRLKPNVSTEQAEVNLASLWHALRAEELKALGNQPPRFVADFLTSSRLRVLPGARGFSYTRDQYRTPFLAIMAMAALVLLICAVNVASLLLVRATGRSREFSLRYALGAEASRILQQLLLEGLLIGIVGGAAGMLLAPIAIRVLVQRLSGEDGSGSFSPSIDTRLLLFNFAIALAVSVLFSLAPVLQLRRPDLTASMRQQSSTGTGGMLNFRRAIVSLQIGLSFILLVGAGLFLRTMQKLHATDVGFTTSHLVTFGTEIRLAGHNPEAAPALNQRILDTLATIPGVQAVAGTDDPELANSNTGGNVTVAGYDAPPEESLDIEEPNVSPNFFSVMQIPLIAGRFFDDNDTRDHPLVVIVNESFARHFCHSVQACVGRRMATGGSKFAPINSEIIGVVRDSKHVDMRQPASPTMFRPLRQMPRVTGVHFYLRTYSGPSQMLSAVRRTMQQLDPTLALTGLRTMEDQIDDSLTNERMVTLLALSFGVLATLLAGIGIYGVLAYSTAQRTREIGIRIALGSTRFAVSRIVLTDVLRLAGIGILLAIPVSLWLSRLVRNQLFGVSPADTITLLAAILVIAAVALLAALIPARRAASINPNEALRSE